MSTENKIENGANETELSVLENIIFRGLDFKEVRLVLEAEDFYTETHQIIYTALETLYNRGEPIELLTVCEELRERPRPGRGSFTSYITNLSMTALPLDKQNLKFHIYKIKSESKMRSWWMITQNLATAIKNGDTDNILSLIEKVREFEYSDNVAHNKLKPISAKDLPDEPPPDALWAGIIYPGSITQLNSEPGAGKSTIAYNIAAMGALGKPFLGIPFTKHIRTLYIDLETPQWLRRQKIETICGELPEDFLLLNDLDLLRDLSDLIQLCKKENYELIVLDTQSKVFAMEDENDNSQANKAVALVEKLTKETNVAVLLIHHTRKGNGGLQAVYRGRGASAIAASVDIVANLEVLDADTLKLKVVKSRIPGVYLSLTMKKLGGDKFERVSTEETNGGLELHRIQDFILNLLGNGEVWRTAKIQERAQREGYKERTVGDALRRLREAGKVIQIKQGYYTLPGAKLDSYQKGQDKIEDFDIPPELY